jgi:hypothetical protein
LATAVLLEPVVTHCLLALVAFAFAPYFIMQRLLYKRDNFDGQLISINVLEFITVIIIYCPALHVI